MASKPHTPACTASCGGCTTSHHAPSACADRPLSFLLRRGRLARVIIWLVIMCVLVLLTERGAAPEQALTLITWSLALAGTATVLLPERAPAEVTP